MLLSVMEIACVIMSHLNIKLYITFIVTCSYIITGYLQNVDVGERDFYRVTLVVSTEQETAIIELFREKHWIYRKIGIR